MKVFLAGGCLWQRQEAALYERVLHGLLSAARIRLQDHKSPAVITLNVVSLMDESVLKQGDYSKGNTNYRADYADAHRALEPYVQDGGNIVLPLASHTETCGYGKRFAEGFKDGNLVHGARTVPEDGAVIDEIATATATPSSATPSTVHLTDM